jgi:hypothetical protein
MGKLMQVIVSLETQNKTNKSATRRVKTRAGMSHLWRSVAWDGEHGERGAAVH